MIDLALLRENPDRIRTLVHKKDPAYNIDQLIDLDAQVRVIRQAVEDLRHEKNELAKQARGGVTPELRERSIMIGKELKTKEAELEVLEQKFNELYLFCPNIPSDDVPVGNKEANKVVKVVGEKPFQKKDFINEYYFSNQEVKYPIKNHVELGTDLGWFDFDAAARMAGSNFALYKGDAVKLLYALAMFMLKNNMKHGFELVLPSVLVNAKSLEVTGNFPKFRDQAYKVPEDDLYLTPTAEVNLGNLYRDHILRIEDLPIRMTAWTSCFRREAGTYGATERGLIRIHQFEKVELYTICAPDKSQNELERMLACAEDILQQLGLHYRISLLAAQDCSFASAKTYDIEVWLPGQGQYYEVSSVSNCTDFQARRGKIRFKIDATSKTELVHTLNGSSLALPRLMVAIMETYQQPDGSIKIPDILKKEALF
ncbi:MAG TPA: serine--tRNA ligase [Candidatus Dependentiae bacterium]|nr:serine--tRNA ligase [Candidatus Dependentiae bacterium]HRQ62343.1 serine--tRNA ligase [Candidatus Dependentiae bacterium]